MDNETTRIVNPESKKVECTVSVRTSKDAPEQSFTWTLDYSGCTDAQILDKAARTDIITLQSRFRAKPFDQTRFDVSKDIIERPRLTDTERLKRAVTKLGLTPEELVKLARELKRGKVE